ncbi:unnamed protein product [Rodentolepis nana]|uniref:EF-hand domain-containing protein n=1 Tax=Rodentolepis nana TaxID=102285 RepID=A0A0R3TDQ4_RODNA|nr:unnamed protein product [Rodentolepis nana]
MIPLRREIEMKNFVDKALKGVCLDKMIPKGISRIRMAVLNDIDKIIKDKSIHFTRFEMVAILNVFYSLLDYQVRTMNKLEFQDFLYLTLGITNMAVLSGFCRAARKISQRGSLKEDGILDGPTFVKMMSILLRGTIDERALLSFYILDEDGDGILSPKSDLSMCLMGTFNPHISASAPNIDPEEPSRDTLRYLIKKMDITTDSGIGIEGFIRECRASPWLVDGILPTLPSETFNRAFQNLVSQAPRLQPIENNIEEPKKVVRKKNPKPLH